MILWERNAFREVEAQSRCVAALESEARAVLQKSATEEAARYLEKMHAQARITESEDRVLNLEREVRELRSALLASEAQRTEPESGKAAPEKGCDADSRGITAASCPEKCSAVGAGSGEVGQCGSEMEKRAARIDCYCGEDIGAK